MKQLKIDFDIHKIEVVPLSKIKINPNNPRFIKDDNFKKLVESLKKFPQMLALRPIIVDDNFMALGGNMRKRAAEEANFESVPIMRASNLSEAQQKEFIIKDNVGFGEWDFDLLANEWDTQLLQDWGLDYDFFEFQDVEPVDAFNESMNFIIKCNNQQEIEQLQEIFNIDRSSILLEDFIDWLNKKQITN